MDPSPESFVDPIDHTEWRVDIAFLASNWSCIWGRGCQGILDEPAPDLGQGCCSFGAQLIDEDEARNVAALAAALDPAIFEHQAQVAACGVFADQTRRATRVVDGACIFLNRPGFAGGAGCALHLGAVAEGDAPIDWKPAVCWQLPLKVDRDQEGRATLRRWQRDDWGPGGAQMAWCCTEEAEALVGDAPAAETLADELVALVGPDVAVAIRRRIADTAEPPHR